MKITKLRQWISNKIQIMNLMEQINNQ